MATKKEDIVAAIEEMSVLDLADLVKTLELSLIHISEPTRPY